MKYFPIVEPWLEPKYKLIAQPPPPISDSDPGDTAQREGMFMFAAFILFQMEKMDATEFFFIQSRYMKVLDLLGDPNNPGFIRRYPDPSYWGGQSDRLSRDQCVPNIAAMAYLPSESAINPSRHLWNFFKAHLKRGLLFTTNTRNNWAWPPGDPRYDAKKYKWKLPDLTFGSFHAMYIRSFRAWPLYPLLLLLDLDMLGGSIVKVLWYGKDPTSNDDLNHLITMYQAELTMPTPWSKLAKWVYRRRLFPHLAGSATNPAQACLNSYFNGNNPGPRLDLVYQEITERFK